MLTKLEFVQSILKERYCLPALPSGNGYAATNIALAKYWGKRDALLNLPFTSSISVTLAKKGAYTDIQVIDSDHDIISVNRHVIAQDASFATRLVAFLDLFRHKNSVRFKVDIDMNIPVKAGLASSACGFASIVLALNNLFAWELESKSLSMLARLGSGSAARSIYDGFVKWHKGVDQDGFDSYAEQISEPWGDLQIEILMLSDQEKYIGSSEAMEHTVKTSPYYAAWVQKAEADLSLIEQAIKQRDFEQLGALAENNALSMHASMMAAHPAIIYSNGKTIEIIKQVQAARKSGIPVFLTQDAGPNIKLLFLKKDAEAVLNYFGIERHI